jgi:hypothetical protein
VVELDVKLIEQEIKDVMKALCINRMPTRPELETFDSRLYSRVHRTGGIIKWADHMNLPLKTPYSNPNNSYNNLSKENFIKESIKTTMIKLNLNRMPSFNEIKETHENSEKILNLIRRNGGYRRWAEELDLELKDCDTKLGTDFEFIIMNSLIEKGFKTDKMPFKFPYDLLINDVTKVDIKTANLFFDKNRNRSMYKYTINKEYHTCDFYIFVALKDDNSILKTLVIPSHIINSQNVSIGIKSKYDIYDNKFELLNKHSNLIKNELI